MLKRLAFLLFSKLFDRKGEYKMSVQENNLPVDGQNAPVEADQPIPSPADSVADTTATNESVSASSDGVSRPVVDDVEHPSNEEAAPAAPVAPAAPAEEVVPQPVVVPPVVVEAPVDVTPVSDAAVSPAPAAVTPSTDSDKTEGEPNETRFDLLASALKSLLQEAGHDLDEAFDDAVPLAKEIASSDEDFGQKLNGILVVVGREYGEAFHKFFNYAKKHI